ncbi:MAG TPA: hypothetical protein VFO03_04235 [Gaiellaceae bacterium]|nr:hypothetical protein [Gaiellaceae bacterium]
MMLLLLLVAVFAAFNLGGTTPSSGTGTQVPMVPTPGPATLSVTIMRPLTVTGRGFKRGEAVRVTAAGIVRRTRASRSGTFTVRFPGQTDGCAIGTVVAVGSRGSRAELNFSNILCVDQ